MDQRETTFGRTENDDSRTRTEGEKEEKVRLRHAAEIWLGGSGSLAEVPSRQFALMREIERGRRSVRASQAYRWRFPQQKGARARPIVKTAGLDAPSSNHHYNW